jgi:hypothetical protein
MPLINAGSSLATAPTSSGALLTAPDMGDADEFVEQPADGASTVAAGVAFLDVPVPSSLRLYTPLPGNGRE